MKNKELIEILLNLPQDLEVLTAIDDEGNGFRKIPEDWVSVEKFYNDEGLEIVAQEDYEEYDELEEYILIG